MRHSLWGFAIASLAPAGLIVVAAYEGGLWAAAALVSVTALVAGLDAALGTSRTGIKASERAADLLSMALVAAHFAVLASATLGVAGLNGLSVSARLALFVAAGLYLGQVSNSNAHELIHRARRHLRRAGALVFTSHLFGHHATAHPAVHHRYVATPLDPNSARLGESVYRFALRAWIGSFRAGLRVEADRLARKSRPAWDPGNPYWGYALGGLGFVIIAATAGWAVLWAYLALALYATFQLLLSDYVQHYGLRRAPAGPGWAPVDARHSWNAPQWYSSLMMLNAPRHSDHHTHPATPFPALCVPPGAPVLPRSLPVMATLALMPRLWQKVMDPRVRRLGQDPLSDQP